MSGTKSFSPDQVQLYIGTPPDDLEGTMTVLMKTNKYYTDGSLKLAKTSYPVTREWGRAAVEAGWAEDTGDVLPVQDGPAFKEGMVAALQTSAAAQIYTWATLPAAADYIGTAFISDVGLSGSLWRSDGATWGIINGSVVLARGHTDLTVTAASTDEVDLVSVPIPAGLMGANGMLEVTHFWEATNNANVKTMRVKLGGTAFFANATALGSSSIFLPPITRIWNRNNQAAQMAFAAANGNTTVATGTAKTTGTVDTSAATTLAISGQKATGTDTLTLLGYSVRLVRP